jgi:predicted metalloprotease with PDZ domain
VKTFAAALALVCLLSTSALAGDPGVTDYRVSPVMDHGALSAIEVQLRFDADASGQTRLHLPNEWGGGDHLWRFVHDLRIGGAQAVSEDGPDVRVIRSAPGAPIVVTYRVANPQPADPAMDSKDFGEPIIRPDWAYMIGFTIFAFPQDSGHKPARFTWSGGPKGWGFASDLDQLSAIGATGGNVLESVILTSPRLKILDREGGASRVRLAVLGDYGFQDAAFSDLVLKIVSAERDFWKAAPSPFLVTLAPLGGKADGSSFRGANLNDSYALIATRNMSLELMRVLLAHEYFHSWNSKQVGGLMEGPREAEGYWFSEGFTDFYARRLALRYGLIDLDGFVQNWNDALAEYASSDVREAANDTIAASFWSNPQMNKLPYDRGSMFAALIDHDVRQASAGRRGIDDIMFAMRAAAHGGGGDGKSDAAQLFPTAARQATGLDVAPLVSRYMVKGEIITLPADAFGGCITVSTVRIPTFDPGFDRDKSAATGIITGVDPAGPAYAAGMRDGFKRVGREGGKDGDSRVELGYRVVDASGVERLILYRPEGRATMTLQQLAVAPGLDAPAKAACARTVSGGQAAAASTSAEPQAKSG